MTYRILLVVSVLTLCFASPLISEDISTNYRNLRDRKYILPDQAIVIDKYEIVLTPDFNNTFTFDGQTTIFGSAKNNNIAEITFHAKRLTFSIVKIIYEDSHIVLIDPIPPIDETYDFWTLKLDRRINQNETFRIEIKYKGLMSEDLYGFYRTSYEEEGQTKWLGTTQFQPVHARRVFPCFDEPKYKSKFIITIRRPKNFQPTISNMKMNSLIKSGSDYVEEKFYETPPMSTYLLAFIVSEFEAASKSNAAESNQVGIWARREARNQGNYAFEITKKLVDAMEQYLKYPISKMHPNLKNDHVAIPEMASGAMENWGIIMYREANLMYTEAESNVRFKQQVAVGAAHEIAHSWFGNLVTCHWWSELWLNEGFATYFQIFLTDKVEQMDMEDQFNVAQLHTAMVLDAFSYSPPLKNDEIYSPSEIDSQFNPITYNKGAALIRMISDFVSARTFQNALINYINETNFKHVDETILCEYLQAQADNDRSIISYPNTNVYMFMTSWTSSNGFPILTVDINRQFKKITLHQKRFTKYNDGQTSPTTWDIPITYTTRGESNFEIERPKFIFTDVLTTIDENRINNEDWIIFNIRQSGYYRVYYDDTSLKLIINALSNDDRENIHPQNRAQIVDDLFNFARENIYKYTDLLDAVQFLELESHFAPWSAAFAGYSFMRLLIQSIPELQRSLDKHILTVMNKTLLPKLEFNENNNDKHIDKLLRINAFNLACKMEFKECVDESKKIFDDFKNNKYSIRPNLREYVYCTALRHGSSDDFEVLWKRYLTVNIMNEKQTILNALGCSNISDKLIKLLFYTISQNSPIRKQDKMALFNSIISGGSPNVDIAFEFIQENVKTIRLVYGPQSLKSMFENIALQMSSDQVTQFENLLSRDKNDLTLEEKEWGHSAVRMAKTNINTAGNFQPDLSKWLNDKHNSTGIISISWLSLFIMQLLITLKNLCFS